MLAKSLTAASKFFTLLSVACCVLGVLSSNVLADPLPTPGTGTVATTPSTATTTACNCGTPPTSPGSTWDAFVTCYNACPCSSECGPAVPPGSPGHEDWLDCYRGKCQMLFGPNFGCLICNQPNPCRIVAGNPPAVVCSGWRCSGPVGCRTMCRCWPSLFVADECVCR